MMTLYRSKHIVKKQQTTVNFVIWVPCHHGMARPQVADGGNGLQVSANILNKQSRTVDKG
jgi:hypothetical protein